MKSLCCLSPRKSDEGDERQARRVVAIIRTFCSPMPERVNWRVAGQTGTGSFIPFLPTSSACTLACPRPAGALLGLRTSQTHSHTLTHTQLISLLTSFHHHHGRNMDNSRNSTNNNNIKFGRNSTTSYSLIQTAQ